MRCEHCQHEIRAGARFCEECGTPIAPRCPSCEAPLSATAKFCSQCGTAVAGDPVPTATPQDRDGEAERRQITAMFCDLAGSTELAQRVDPEELREILRTYQQTCAQMVARFDGHVAQLLGDGVLVYFGYPRAHEDDAQRAVRAGLAIQAELAKWNEERAARDEDLVQARIGIHTGPVVISALGGTSGRRETLALGDTIIIASRLEGLAELGQVLVSEATLRLVEGSVESRDLGTPPLKGVSEPIRVYGIERVVRSAPGAVDPRDITGVSGREAELARLHDCWHRVLEGRGHVATVSGEAGIGKSRVLQGLRRGLPDTPHRVLEFECTPYTAGNAFKPILEMVEHVLGFEEDEAPDARLAKLEQALVELAPERCAEILPFVASLLGLPESERYPLEHMSPELQRERSLRALVAPIRLLAEREPLLLIGEDLHWADPSTLAFLSDLADQAPSSRLLLLLTFREEFASPWPEGEDVSAIALERLDAQATRALVSGVVGAGRVLPDELVGQIAERADGVPLYAVELTKAVVESERLVERDGRLELQGKVSDLSIPSTLQGSLMARLDRIRAAKQVAQLGATLGRSFPFDLIAAVADLDEGELQAGLRQLVDAEILVQRGTPPEATYTFRHRLLQDTAYESQLKKRRTELHARTSQAYEQRFPQRIASAPEVVAHHCAEGGLTAEAVDYFQQAGEVALSRHANQESRDYYARSLELHGERPPEDPDSLIEHRAKEVALRLGQCVPMTGLDGFEAAEVLDSIARCEALSDTFDTGPAKIPIVHGLMMHYSNAGLLARARDYADQLIEIIEPIERGPLLLAGRMNRAFSGPTTAPLPVACRDFEQAIALADEIDPPPPIAAMDADAKSGMQAVYAISLVLSGRPTQGLQVAEASIERALALGHPRTIAIVLGNGGATFSYLEDAPRVAEAAKQVLEATADRGFEFLEASGLALDAWARTKLGDADGLGAFDAALRYAEDAGVVGGLPKYYLMAADAETEAGNPERAFERVAKCRSLCKRTKEFSYFPQSLLSRARAHWVVGARDEAFTDLERALGMWKGSGAIWLELDAAVTYADFALESNQKRAEARAFLEPVYASFEDGFETPLLRRAEALRERLG
ncbi:MAG: adenylate/guanylate cyclase domain-containing protein [Myxococcota bacterium]